MFAPGDPYDLVEVLTKADAGDVDAMIDAVIILASEGYTDKGGDADIHERQIGYLRKLIDEKWDPAYIMLADHYVDGTGVEQNIDEAIRLYEKAAENGIDFGFECIGTLYFEGIHVAKDYKKAFSYFKKIRKNRRNLMVRYALGEMYRLGLYVRKNEKKC